MMGPLLLIGFAGSAVMWGIGLYIVFGGRKKRP